MPGRQVGAFMTLHAAIPGHIGSEPVFQPGPKTFILIRIVRIKYK